MYIEPRLAQDIVVSMKEIINQEINFINTDSIIIASTDENRIGEFHGGARTVVQTKSDLIIEYEGQFEGTKKGINIPIYTDLQLVGVIGITGDKDEVEKYGKIIKNMTEILIKDAWLKDVSFKKRENYRIFFEQIMSDSTNEDNILHLANILEINLALPRKVAIGVIKNFSGVSNAQIEGLSNTMHKLFAGDKQIIFNINGPEIKILFNSSDGESNIQRQLLTLIQQAHEQFQLALVFGLGNLCDDISEIKVSYNQALASLNWALVNSNAQLEAYDDLDLGIILTNLSPEISNQFVQKTIGALSKTELDEYDDMLTIYGRNNGSNYKTADELFIHKNTLQYKLIKLHKITGYDPREIDDYAILSLAFKLHNIIQTKKKNG